MTEGIIVAIPPTMLTMANPCDARRVSVISPFWAGAADFTKMVGVFDARSASFLAVTQQ
jgi:hypothetical protein